MNLIKELQKDFNKASRDRMVQYIGHEPNRFKELVAAFISGPYRISQRAAWPLSYSVKKYPELIKPHLRKVILNLKKSDMPDAVKRNTVRLLQFIDIPKSLQGHVLDVCIGYLQDPSEPTAIRVFSMSVLGNLAEAHPDLKKELIAIIGDQMPYESAGFAARGRKVLKNLKK